MVYARTIGGDRNFMLIQPSKRVQYSEVIDEEGAARSFCLVPRGWSSGLHRVKARVLQVTSPDRMKFKEFLKESEEDLKELDHIAGPSLVACWKARLSHHLLRQLVMNVSCKHGLPQVVCRWWASAMQLET
jgi:hypothetical protein